MLEGLYSRRPIAKILGAIGALTSNGLIARTGAGTVAARSITGTANEITVTNGDGVSGAPTISLPTAITATGKTVTGGTLASPTITDPTITGIQTVNGGATARLNDSDKGFVVNATHATYSDQLLDIVVDRASTGSYGFLYARSGGSGGDTEFVLNGDGNGYADGTWNNSGADYAEYFETVDGEAIPRGVTVVLEGNKVRAATKSDSKKDIFGVARPKENGRTSMVIGNTAWNHWSGKYLTDDFGVFVIEDYEVELEDGSKVVQQRKKRNPAWKGDEGYKPRSERDEWVVVGLLGQVPVNKGQPVGERWIKMRAISADVDEWLVR